MAKQRSNARRYAAVQKLQIGPISWDMGAFGLIHYARDFAASARALPPPETFRPTRYYLACHAIELGLKAFLALMGRSVVELVDAFGHDIAKAMEQALALGLRDAAPAFTAELQDEVRKASAPYNDKVFEYPALVVMVTGFRDCPDAERLMNAADVLVEALYGPCLAYGEPPAKSPTMIGIGQVKNL